MIAQAGESFVLIAGVEVVDQETDISRAELLERAAAEQDAVPGDPTVNGRQTTEVAEVRCALESRCRHFSRLPLQLLGVHIDRLRPKMLQPASARFDLDHRD